jgi:aryl-alcohol dehydrogenase-like predicted oxidoreductase
VLPFFPLANGLLTGKYSRDVPPPAGTRLGDRKPELYERAPWDTLDRLGRYAADRGLEMIDVAIGGLAALPAVTSVIAGATSPEQVRANTRAGEWEPGLADLAELDQVLPRQGDVPPAGGDH